MEVVFGFRFDGDKKARGLWYGDTINIPTNSVRNTRVYPKVSGLSR